MTASPTPSTPGSERDDDALRRLRRRRHRRRGRRRPRPAAAAAILAARAAADRRRDRRRHADGRRGGRDPDRDDEQRRVLAGAADPRHAAGRAGRRPTRPPDAPPEPRPSAETPAPRAAGAEPVDAATPPDARDASRRAPRLGVGRGADRAASRRSAAARRRPPADEPVERAVRVGGQIKRATKIRNVQPVYPPIAQSARVQGIVIIEATIDPDGKVTRDARAPLDPAARSGGARRGPAVGVRADAAERRRRAGHHDRDGQLHAAVRTPRPRTVPVRPRPTRNGRRSDRR